MPATVRQYPAYFVILVQVFKETFLPSCYHVDHVRRCKRLHDDQDDEVQQAHCSCHSNSVHCVKLEGATSWTGPGKPQVP